MAERDQKQDQQRDQGVPQPQPVAPAQPSKEDAEQKRVSSSGAKKSS